MRIMSHLRDRARWLSRGTLFMLLAHVSGASFGTESRAGLFTFNLHGGYFYGPGPIVPDTQLPDGKLTNIHFDLTTWRGYCEFQNDGSSATVLSDGQTRINQNIDAGKLYVGGGTSPILLAAVDGGPHRGQEEYALDKRYRLVWRVDIALDSGFPEGIIRLNDFVLTTGVAQIARSHQSERGEPGGYDQAGSLSSGTLIAGRLGDFDQDGFLDGVLVAAPIVPLSADMLPGAPVGNRRGFRTNVPIKPGVSLELILRGVSELQDPIDDLLRHGDLQQIDRVAEDVTERLKAARLSLERARSEAQWRSSREAGRVTKLTAGLESLSVHLEQLLRTPRSSPDPTISLRTSFADLANLINEVAALNDLVPGTLPRAAR